MTERLYYKDSYLRAFDANVISCEPESGRWKVHLDRTAFYPTSGGQPHDTGTLGGIPVVEVAEAEDHSVVHYLSAELRPGPVRGEIDWSRRIDHMQQHTGQHLLSAVFLELFQFPTVSFHLGRESSTIDLQAPEIVVRHIEQAERRTNEVILEDRVVTVRFGTAQELEEAGVRKKVEREGILRAIEIEGVDRQPCGGTHLARTGEAGLLLIRKLERRREAWRLEFVCGYRALAMARGDFETLSQAATLLSCGSPAVPSAISKMLDERKTQHTASKKLEERLADHEARALLAAAANSALGRIVAAALDDATPAYLAMLASKLTAEAKVIAVLASRATGHIVFAQTKGAAGAAAADMNALLREAAKEFGGKGGGAKDFAQGSIPVPAQADALVAKARGILTG
jgi:alanyl-tRNA synthetase